MRLKYLNQLEKEMQVLGSKVKSMLLTQVFVFLMFRDWKKSKNLKLLLQMKDQYD